VGGWVQWCRRCGHRVDLADPRWRCRCGGLLDLQGPAADPIGTTEPWSLWRYRSVLPPGGNASAWEKVTLGEGSTPLLPVRPGLWVKLDYVMPTRSFKDRGAAVMVALAAGMGVTRLVADSSGNAGRSVAAYAARAGIAAEVYVPEETAADRIAAIEAFGARLVRVPGGRAATAVAAQAAADRPGTWYASHVYRPAFAHGVKTVAFELWQQLGGRAPGTVVVPAGNGTLVLGLWLGFRELVAAGRVARLPQILAVQAERCAPLAGRRPTGSTAAVGIAIAHPPRAGEVRAAVLASGGRFLLAAEDDLAPARAELAGMGMVVEPTAAAAWAGWTHQPGRTHQPRRTHQPSPGPVVVVLTGTP
jgi:threonine synthase